MSAVGRGPRTGIRACVTQLVLWLLVIPLLLHVSGVSAAQSPYPGAPFAVPGQIEAEDYDLGGEGVAYHDTTVGNAGGVYRNDDVDIWEMSGSPGQYGVSAQATGEWREYTIDVGTAGDYTLELRVATPHSGRKAHVEIDGVDKTGSIVIPNTGAYSAYQTVSVPVTLSAGQQVLRFAVDKGGFALDWLNLVAAGGGGGTVLLSDDFNDGDAAGWTTVNDTGVTPSWTVDSGVYRQAYSNDRYFGWWNGGFDNDGTADLIYRLGFYSYYVGGSFSDIDYSVTVTPATTTPKNDDCGLMWRRQDGNNYYRLSFSHVDGFTLLEKKVSGTWSTLAKNGRGIPKGTPVRWRVVNVGDLIEVYQDGTKLFAVQDASLASGTVALYARGACDFDDVQVLTPDAAPSIVLGDPVDHTVVSALSTTVKSVVRNAPVGASVRISLDGTSCGVPSQSGSGLYTVQCTAPAPGVYEVSAELLDADGVTVLDSDTHAVVGFGGMNLVGSGDSITDGADDYYASDGDSDPTYGFRKSLQGYHSNLIDLLNGPAPVATAHNVLNAGNPGDQVVHLADRIDSVLERHADADVVPLLIGTNDAGIGSGPRPSGLGCSGASCNGTYYAYLQSVVDAVNASGKTPYVALVPPRFGTRNKIYVDPHNDPDGRNAMIREYNQVIQTQLNGAQLGPDFYSFFLDPSAGINRFFLFFNHLHPGALAQQIIAAMWNNAVNPSHPVALPYFADDICLRLTQGGACEQPLLYKEELKEVGDEYYTDEQWTLLSIPSVLQNGRWIVPANADRNRSNSDYLSLDLGTSTAVTVYVAFDEGAVSLPSWMAGYSDTGLTVQTTSTSAPHLRLYRAPSMSGVVTFGGADAATTGANANYVVIIVPQ